MESFLFLKMTQLGAVSKTAPIRAILAKTAQKP
jgi:hypothetical protein